MSKTNKSAASTMTATLPEAPAGFVDFQSDSFASCEGFWNLPKDGDDAEYVGEFVHGILLNEVRTRAGKPLDNPFFVVELSSDHKRITVRDENKQESEVEMAAGHRVGFSSTWKALQGLNRKVGHEVWIRYDGKKRLPNGRVAKALTVRCSPKAVREVEQISEQSYNQGDDSDLPEQLRG